MRDPDLVKRAERAATALERAWIHWRTMHGLGSDPLPPVSSYVGYSLEEPWGQPRVVFGVGAEEAERLAAMLDGHDCVGPIHAEMTGRPEWRPGPGIAGRPIDEPRTFGEPRSLDQPRAFGEPRAFREPQPSDQPRAYGEPRAFGEPRPSDQPRAFGEPRPSDQPRAFGEPRAYGEPRAFGEQLRIPAQAPQPLADMLPPGSYANGPAVNGVPSGNVIEPGPVDRGVPNDGVTSDGAAVESAAVESADAAAHSSSPADAPPADARPGDAVLADVVPADGTSAESTPDDGRAQDNAGPPEHSALAGEAGEADELAPEVAFDSDANDVYLAQPVAQKQPEPDGTEQLSEAGPLEIVAFEERPEQFVGSAEEPAPLPASPVVTSASDLMPNQGPGYRGPRYQGSPPQYQPGPSRQPGPRPEPASPDHAAAQAQDRETATPHDQPSAGQAARNRARQFAKRGRTRRQGPGAHEAWESADERSASDHAV